MTKTTTERFSVTNVTRGRSDNAKTVTMSGVDYRVDRCRRYTGSTGYGVAKWVNGAMNTSWLVPVGAVRKEETGEAVWVRGCRDKEIVRAVIIAAFA